MTTRLDRELTEGVLRLDAQAGPARRISAERSEALIDSALDLWQQERGDVPSDDGEGVPRSMIRDLRPRRRRWWPVAGGVVLALGGMAAAHQAISSRASEPVEDAVSAIPSDGAKPRAGSLPRGEAAPARETLAASPPEEPVASPAAPPAAKSLAPARAATAEDGLRQANRLRAEGRFRDAEQAYLGVTRAHPGSGAAYVARVAAGTLRLDHLGDPRGARALLGAARSAGGPLDLEVQSGLARASRQLGDRRGEAAALEGLIAAHPGSRAATDARARLVELRRASAVK